MPYIPKAPAELAHLDDRTVARALSRRFGDVVRAAEDLGVPRSALTRRTWHNPKLFTWAHERIDLFLFAVQDEIIGALDSPRAKRRQWAVDQLLVGSNHPLAALLTPASRSRGPNHSAAAVDETRLAREQLDREAAAELAREREREAAAEREREIAADRERIEVIVMRRPSAPSRVSAQPTSTRSLWPSYVRRPTRGQR